MHIHGNSMSINAADFYSAAQGRAVTAERAAEVRKKLLKSASEIEGAAIPDESLQISCWMDSRHSPVQGQVQSQPRSQDEGPQPYHASTAGKDSDFG
jgi:hypothetical protein